MKTQTALPPQACPPQTPARNRFQFRLSGLPALVMLALAAISLTGEPHYATQFADPAFEKSMGYNGKVFSLFESAHLAINWDAFDPNILPVGSPDRSWVDAKRAEINRKYDAAKGAGLKVYCMSDLILFPKRLVSLHGMTKTMRDVNDRSTL